MFKLFQRELLFDSSSSFVLPLLDTSYLGLQQPPEIPVQPGYIVNIVTLTSTNQDAVFHLSKTTMKQK